MRALAGALELADEDVSEIVCSGVEDAETGLASGSGVKVERVGVLWEFMAAAQARIDALEVGKERGPFWVSRPERPHRSWLFVGTIRRIVPPPRRRAAYPAVPAPTVRQGSVSYHLVSPISSQSVPRSKSPCPSGSRAMSPGVRTRWRWV